MFSKSSDADMLYVGTGLKLMKSADWVHITLVLLGITAFLIELFTGIGHFYNYLYLLRKTIKFIPFLHVNAF